MIETHKQYEITKETLQKIEAALNDHPPTPPVDSHPRLWQANFEALVSISLSLRQQLTGYEAERGLKTSLR